MAGKAETWRFVARRFKEWECWAYGEKSGGYRHQGFVARKMPDEFMHKWPAFKELQAQYEDVLDLVGNYAAIDRQQFAVFLRDRGNGRNLILTSGYHGMNPTQKWLKTNFRNKLATFTDHVAKIETKAQKAWDKQEAVRIAGLTKIQEDFKVLEEKYMLEGLTEETQKALGKFLSRLAVPSDD